jgi:D-threo-aldose 1-dehydrogenase
MTLLNSDGPGIDPFKTRKLGNSDLMVPCFGFGGGTLGDPNEVTSDEQAQATLAVAYDAGIRYFDTAPWYGLTKSEHRMGQFLRNQPRDSFCLNTKVGRVFRRPDNPETFSQDRWKGGFPFDLRFDYTRNGLQRSYEDSLMRLGMNRVDSLAIHDLDFKFHKTEEGVAASLDELEKGGGFEWLLDMKARGEIKAIGAGVNQAEMIPKFLERFEGIDWFLVAMPYTLLDQPALDGVFELCENRGVSVIIGAVFASGILATGVTGKAIYSYLPADQAVVTKVKAIQAIADRYGVPLGAAALQFPLWHPVVVSVIPGSNSPEIVKSNINWMSIEIPKEFWSELKTEGLLREDAPVGE